MTLARQLWPGITYGNQALRHSPKPEVSPPDDLHAHRALYDCYITAALLVHIMDASGWDAEEMVRRMQTKGLESTFPFGKYRGQAIDSVAKKDPGYLHWMLKNIPDLKPNLRITMQRALGIDD